MPTSRLKTLAPIRRLQEALVLLVVVGGAGATGYHILSNLGWLDAWYMAITTLFTVGFREMGAVNDHTKLFTVFYLVTGLGVATYAISNLTALIVEGDLQGYIRERGMEKRMGNLRDHIIICGFGKMGFQAAWEMKQAGVPFIIIEQDSSKGKTNPRFAGDLFLHGNALDEAVLERAGITRARGLITALTSDADNVLVTLTARQMAPDIPIVARSAKLGIENKLKAAGATHIVSPYEIGGRRMASLLLRPGMVKFFDVVLHQDQLELGMERIRVDPSSSLVGQTMRDSRLRDSTGALIVGINRQDAGLRFNPTGEETFQADDELLVMGPSHALEAMMKLAGG